MMDCTMSVQSLLLWNAFELTARSVALVHAA